MKKISQTTQFARDVKRIRKRGKDLSKLESIVTKLALGTSLEQMHKDHPLLGAWRPSRDCHI
jgi:mRNA interferase YafQ